MQLLQSHDNAATSVSKTLGVELSDLLQRAFGVEFAVLDGQSGDVLHIASGQPARDWALRAELCREVARRGRPELIDDEDPFFTLALPLSDAAGNALVAAPPSSRVAWNTTKTSPARPNCWAFSPKKRTLGPASKLRGAPIRRCGLPNWC